MSIILNPVNPLGSTAQYNAQDIIKAAFKILGITAKGETPSADEMNDAFQSLNMMLDHWSASNIIGLAYIRESFPLTAGKGSYTIGENGDFVTKKPFDIVGAFYRDAMGNDYPMDVINRDQYDNIQDKSFTQAPPMALFYDPGDTQQVSQVGTIFLYYIPDSSQRYTLFIESQKPFTEFSGLTDMVTFPPSYLSALKWNLALEIFPEYYGSLTPIPPLINARALETLDVLESLNSPRLTSAMDLPGMKGGFNIVTGDFNP